MRTGAGLRALIVFLLGFLLAGYGAVGQPKEWPDCNFNCTAKDVSLQSAYIEETLVSCQPGTMVTATLYGAFRANATRYAVWILGDITSEGALIQKLDQCVADTITPGATEIPLAVVTWPCGAALDLENVIVSWEASAASCGDVPECKERGAKCSRPTVATIRVPFPLAIGVTSDAPRCPSQPVSFSATVTGGTAPFTYSWSFGDGTPPSAQPAPSHAYAQGGMYTVALRVTDSQGKSATASDAVLIYDAPFAGAENGGPYCAGDTIELAASGGVSYLWTGPAGFQSSEPNPSIPDASLLNTGGYTVTVTDALGCTAQATTDVVVNACLRTLSVASTGGGTVTSPGEGTFTYPAGTVVPLVAEAAGCHVFDGWSGDVDELADPTAPSTSVTLERDTVLQARFVFADDDPPQLLCPPDVTVACGDSTAPAATGEASATDRCDPSPRVTSTDVTLPGGCPGERTIVRTWAATDASGNRADCEQTITVRDTTPPALVVSSATFECDGEGNLDDIASWLASASATDACGSAEISYEEPQVIGGCPGVGSDTVTFTATDACGNGVERAVSVTIVDTTPPQAGDDTAAITEDTPAGIDVLGNDSDTCGAPLRIVAVGIPSLGSASILGDTIRYEPPRDGAGTDSFTYTVEDCSGNRDTALVEVTIEPVNDPPIAQDQSRVTSEDTATGFFSLAVSDPDNTLAELTCDCVTPPQHGSVERGPNHTVTYAPDPDYTGQDAFTYEVCDPGGLCDTATVRITVTAENDNPAVTAQGMTTPEDTPVQIPVTHADPDGDPLSCSVSDPAHGTVSPTQATVSGPYPQGGSLTYTPDPDYSGTDSFTIICDDGNGGQGAASVEITVEPVNDPPIARDQSRVTSEDTPTGFFSLAVSDPDNTLAEIVCDCVNPPQHGSVERGPNHTVNYTPDPDYAGEDAFTYEVCDPEGLCDTATVRVTVTPVNDPPIAGDDRATTSEDQPIEIDVAANDEDPDGNLVPATIRVVGPAASGSASVDPLTGRITYTPFPDVSGTVAFTYEICDAGGLCDTARVTVEVTPVNDPPVADGQAVATPEDTALPIVLSGSDVDGDRLIYRLLSEPIHGSTSGFDPATGALVYAPDPDASGLDRFTFEVCDPRGACSTAIVEIVITPVNDPPTAQDETVGLAEDTPVELVLLGSDPDGDVLTFELLNGPGHGVLTAFDPASGQAVYTPDPGYSGEDQFAYSVCDPSGACDEAVVRLVVDPVNAPPLAERQALVTQEDLPLPITLRGTDPDGDPLRFAIVGGPVHGAVASFDPSSGALTYTPDPGEAGIDSLVFVACDPSGACDTAVVTILVSPVNDPPVALSSDTAVSSGWLVPLRLNGTDPDGDPLTYTIVDGPGHGQILRFDPATGRFTYLSAPDYVGPDALSFEVCDPSGACDRGIVQLFVVDGGGGGGEAELPWRVVLSEIAWAGTAADPNGEWIELANAGDETVDLSGWVLRWRPTASRAGEESVWRVIALSGGIDPNAPAAGAGLRLVEVQAANALWRVDRRQDGASSGFFLLERGSDAVVSDVRADLVYDGSLVLDDAGDRVELLDRFGRIVDSAGADVSERAGWPAGDLATRGTMERIDLSVGDADGTWHTNAGVVTSGRDAVGDPLSGTARAENAPPLSAWAEALRLDPRPVEIGSELVIRLPWSEADVGAVARVVLTRAGAPDAVRLAATWTQLASGLEARIATRELVPGDGQVWIAFEDGRIFLVPVRLSD